MSDSVAWIYLSVWIYPQNISISGRTIKARNDLVVSDSGPLTKVRNEVYSSSLLLWQIIQEFQPKPALDSLLQLDKGGFGLCKVNTLMKCLFRIEKKDYTF